MQNQKTIFINNVDADSDSQAWISWIAGRPSDWRKKSLSDALLRNGTTKCHYGANHPVGTEHPSPRQQSCGHWLQETTSGLSGSWRSGTCAHRQRYGIPRASVMLRCLVELLAFLRNLVWQETWNLAIGVVCWVNFILFFNHLNASRKTTQRFKNILEDYLANCLRTEGQKSLTEEPETGDCGIPSFSRSRKACERPVRMLQFWIGGTFYRRCAYMIPVDKSSWAVATGGWLGSSCLVARISAWRNASGNEMQWALCCSGIWATLVTIYFWGLLSS